MRALMRRLLRRLPVNQPSDHPFWDVTPSGMDLRGMETAECLCGSRMFYTVAYWDDGGEVAGYLTSGLCCDCKALVSLPAPVEGDERWTR